MRILLVIVFIIAVVFQHGCSYPRYQSFKLEELTFENKRLEDKTRYVQEFIRPEETADVLNRLTLQNFSSNQEENRVLNILDYTQQMKQRRDKRECWQYPCETITKGGDCEDKTFLLLSMLIQAGIEGVQGVKGRHLGSGHMWVEYNGYILDPSKRTPKLIPIGESAGYTPHFKFDKCSSYFCKIERR